MELENNLVETEAQMELDKAVRRKEASNNNSWGEDINKFDSQY